MITRRGNEFRRFWKRLPRRVFRSSKRRMSEADLSEIRRLAAQLSSQFGGDPVASIKAAEELIEESVRPLEEWVRANFRIEKNWEDGIKYLTGDSHLGHALRKFAAWQTRNRFVGIVIPVNLPGLRSVLRGLADWEKYGFTREELEQLKKIFRQNEKNLLEAPASKKPAKSSKRTAKSSKRTARSSKG
jgi:hypothetical protein